MISAACLIAHTSARGGGCGLFKSSRCVDGFNLSLPVMRAHVELSGLKRDERETNARADAGRGRAGPGPVSVRIRWIGARSDSGLFCDALHYAATWGVGLVEVFQEMELEYSATLDKYVIGI